MELHAWQPHAAVLKIAGDMRLGFLTSWCPPTDSIKCFGKGSLKSLLLQ